MLGLVLLAMLYPYELIIQLNPGFTHSHSPLLLLPWKYAPHKAYCHSLKLFYSYTESEHPKIFPCSFLLAIYPRSMLQVSFVIPDVKLSRLRSVPFKKYFIPFWAARIIKKKERRERKTYEPSLCQVSKFKFQEDSSVEVVPSFIQIKEH